MFGMLFQCFYFLPDEVPYHIVPLLTWTALGALEATHSLGLFHIVPNCSSAFSAAKVRTTKWPRLLKVLAFVSAAELRILRLLLEVRLQNRDTHQLLSQLDGRMARLEASGAEAAPPPPVIAETSLPRLPAMTVAELETANEAIRVECVAISLVFTFFNFSRCLPVILHI